MPPELFELGRIFLLMVLGFYLLMMLGLGIAMFYERFIEPWWPFQNGIRFDEDDQN